MNGKKKNIIVLVGGGSGGPTSPLLAVANEIKNTSPTTRFVFIGTKSGVERHMVKKVGIPFVAIVSAKFRRYWSLQNIFSPLLLIVAFVQSYRILSGLNPRVVFGVGSFVQVPVVWAAWVLGIPVCIHQQDVLLGLANKLCAPFAKQITVTFEESIADFPHGWLVANLQNNSRVVWTGNPAREFSVPTQHEALAHFKLSTGYPTLLVIGGGTGSSALNSLVTASLKQLLNFANVIHITGKNKNANIERHERYRAYEFLDEIEYAYSASDIVIARAGLSTITELATFKKPCILVPMPNSHQQYNANFLAKRGAVLTFDQHLLNATNFPGLVRGLIFDHTLQKDLALKLRETMPKQATQKVARIILNSLEA